jgi:hypothetical protein
MLEFPTIISRQVSTEENVKIPGQAEMLIDVYVNRVEEDDIEKEAEYLLEPYDSFAVSYKLMITSTLVDLTKQQRSKIKFYIHFRFQLL